MLKVVGGHAEQVSGNHGIAFCDEFEALPFNQAYGRVDDRFRCESMLAAVFEPEDVANQVEGADLATPV
jgi:hypothetical protein